jgi:hypothetical protein
MIMIVMMMMMMIINGREKRANKNTATDNGLYNTINAIHNAYYAKQITRNS